MKTNIEIGRIYLSEEYDCFFYLDWNEMTIYIKNDKTVREYIIQYDDFINIFEEKHDFNTLEDDEIAQFIYDDLECFLTNIIKGVEEYGSLRKTIVYNTHRNLFNMFSDLLYYELTTINFDWVD